MYKYVFWDGLYCIIFCMEYFVFFLKELRETVQMGISYALENGGYNFFGFIIWKLKLFMIFFGFFGGVCIYVYIHSLPVPAPIYIYIHIYIYICMYVCMYVCMCMPVLRPAPARPIKPGSPRTLVAIGLPPPEGGPGV